MSITLQSHASVGHKLMQASRIERKLLGSVEHHQ
jgi:hypothetical protein